ncbi:MAG: cellulase N-terminal Ig-like domain-containing protein [Eubacteriales bacterium]
MKKNKKTYIIVVTLFAIIAIFATSLLYDHPTEFIVVQESITYAFPEETNIDYVIPISRPNVLVNQNGYEGTDTMLVLFQGSMVPDTFEVVDCETERVVYTGAILEYDQEDVEEFTYYGDFSQLVQEGCYYIQADYIGCSYPFEIGSDIYEEMFKESYFSTVEEMLNSSSLVEEVSMAITILQAYEFYPTNFTDDTGILESGNKIPDIFDAMQEVIGQIEQAYEDGITYPVEDQYIIAGFLAKYAYFYGEYNPEDASRYITLAKSMWNDSHSREEVTIMSEYFASCELYRVTNLATYHTVVQEYSDISISTYDSNNIYKLFGDITYLSTTGSVDKTYCAKLMAERINRGISIANEAEQNGGLKLADTVEQMCYHAYELMIIDYILVSHEYQNMVKDQLAYLGGANSEGVNYFDQIKTNPLFLMIMCDMVIDVEVGN